MRCFAFFRGFFAGEEKCVDIPTYYIQLIYGRLAAFVSAELQRVHYEMRLSNLGTIWEHRSNGGEMGGTEVQC